MSTLFITEKEIEAGETMTNDFVFPANGVAGKEEILKEGGYGCNYNLNIFVTTKNNKTFIRVYAYLV